MDKEMVIELLEKDHHLKECLEKCQQVSIKNDGAHVSYNVVQAMLDYSAKYRKALEQLKKELEIIAPHKDLLDIIQEALK